MQDYFDNLDVTEQNLKYFMENHSEIYRSYEQYGRAVHQDGGPLDQKTCWLIKVALSTECQYPYAIRTHILKALHSGCSKEEIEHAILLVAPTAGFPKTMYGLLALRNVIGDQTVLADNPDFPKGS